MPSRPHARRVTSLMLGDTSCRGEESWLDIAPHETGMTVVSEKFARPRMPARALAALRSEPCFYICVDSILATLASVPGRPMGASQLSGGMRELCVETESGMVVLAEVA